MTKIKIIETIGRIAVLALALTAFWLWSNHQVEKRVQAECLLKQAQVETKVIETKQKEVENVAQKRAVIYSRPNAKRERLLAAMRDGTL